MIIVSQDGDRTIPFEEVMLSVEDISDDIGLMSRWKGKKYAIVACKDPDCSALIIGAFSTEEAAKEELKAMVNFYAMPGDITNKVFKISTEKKTESEKLLLF